MLKLKFLDLRMQSVTKRVMLAADKTRAVRLNFQESHLTFSSKTMGGSSGSENVSISGYDGGSLSNCSKR